MKIFFYVNVLGGGGAERVISNLANQFHENGDEVGVVTSYRVENEYFVHSDISRFQLDDDTDYSSRLKKNFYRIKKLRKILKQEKPDVLVSFMAEPNYRAVLAAKGLKTKVVISVRNDPNKEYAGKSGRLLGKKLLPSADGCVFQTEDAKAWFPKRLQKKSAIIMNQVAPVFYNTRFDGERKDIITAGRLTKQKNHPLLIKAFNRIKDKIEDNLIIYGKGEMAEELSALISELGLQDRVFLPGATTNIPETIKSAKVFVLSSDYEGMPNALMEALAMGIPCISTDCPCGGPRMIITSEENGILVPVNNEEELANSMERLANNREYASALGEKAKERALDYYPDRIFSEWKDYIYTVFGKR